MFGQASPGVKGGNIVGDGWPYWERGGLVKLLYGTLAGGCAGAGTGTGGCITIGGRFIGVKGGGRIFCNRILAGLGGFWGGLGAGGS